jgi:glutathione S-transferase
MSEIVLHGFPFSPYVRAVAMSLALKGLAYREQTVDLRPVPGGLRSPEHLQLHPFGRVPILEDADFRIYETQAILRYLDARYPAPALQPADPRALGRMSQIIGIVDCYLFPQTVRPLGAERVVRPALMGATPDEAVVAEALRAAAVAVEALEALVLADGFLVGDTLSAADVILAPQLHLITPVPEVRALLQGTRLLGWLERMLAHPAMTATPAPAQFKLPSSLRDLQAA